MDFEWDEDKRLANLRKHGVDFVDVPAIFDGDTGNFSITAGALRDWVSERAFRSNPLIAALSELS